MYNTLIISLALIVVPVVNASTPYTVSVVERHMRYQGKSVTTSPIYDRTITYARSSDGSYVEKTVARAGAKVTTERTIYSTRTKQFIHVIDEVASKSTVPLSDSLLKNRRLLKESATRECAVSTYPGIRVVGHEVQNGLDVVHLTFGTSVVKTEVWAAPTLDCQPIRWTRITYDRTGKPIHQYERVTQSLTVAEPDPAIFDVPEAYIERLPSQILTMQRGDKPGAAASTCDRNFGDREDQGYLSLQKAKAALDIP